MAIEKADLSSPLNVDEMAPVSPAPAAQGQASQGAVERKPRRREPPPEEVSVEAPAEDADQPPHRIDSLA
jgi:hypothetical protein